MSADQINSFVGKFVSLWSLGNDVSLKLNAVNGKAKIAFELDLGKFQSLKSSNDHTESKHFPPSRQGQRRRERKFHENFDLSPVKEANNPFYDNDDKERNSDIIEDEVHDRFLVDSKEEVNKLCVNHHDNADVQAEVSETCNNVESDTVLDVATMNDPKSETEDLTANDDIAPESDAVETQTLKSHIDNGIEITEPNSKSDLGMEQHDVISASQGSDKDDVQKTEDTTVHVKINFENCQSQKLHQEHLLTIQGIVHRNDHLKKNVKNIEIGEYRTFRGSSEYYYDHNNWMKLKVDSFQL